MTFAIAPKTANVKVGGTQKFTTNSPNTNSDKYAVSGSAGGKVDNYGNYSNPAKAGTDTVVATDNTGATDSSVVTVS